MFLSESQKVDFLTWIIEHGTRQTKNKNFFGSFTAAVFNLCISYAY